jgi:hypothetical protein
MLKQDLVEIEGNLTLHPELRRKAAEILQARRAPPE